MLKCYFSPGLWTSVEVEVEVAVEVDTVLHNLTLHRLSLCKILISD